MGTPHLTVQLAQFITAMFKALTALSFAAAIMMVADASAYDESPAKWYLVETEGRIDTTEPTTKPTTKHTTTPCPHEDKNAVVCAVVTSSMCETDEISTLCGKTCKCGARGSTWGKR